MIGFLIIATNHYVEYAKKLVHSIKSNIYTDEVKFFCFSNKTVDGCTNFPIQHIPWPMTTLLRYHYFMKYWKEISGVDYLYYIDADMRVVGPIDDHILSDFVVTEHPGFYGKKSTAFPLESHPHSMARVKSNAVSKYYVGAFQGGKREFFGEMSYMISEAIEQDLLSNYIAVYHDESHLQRFALSNPPTKILSPAYCMPEIIDDPTCYHPQVAQMDFDVRVLALKKPNPILFRKG